MGWMFLGKKLSSTSDRVSQRQPYLPRCESVAVETLLESQGDPRRLSMTFKPQKSGQKGEKERKQVLDDMSTLLVKLAIKTIHPLDTCVHEPITPP